MAPAAAGAVSVPLPTAVLFHHAKEFTRSTAGFAILMLLAVPLPSSTPSVFAPPRSLPVTS